ncbi:MAG: DUF2065 domain-containing protein [Symbiopectobacterium sp.]
MSITIWLTLGLVLIVEGLGLLFPRIWRHMILVMAQQLDTIFRRFGGGLVVAGIVIYCMLRHRAES